MRAILFALAVGLPAAAPARSEPSPAAFFGVEFVDTSLGADQAAERARAGMVEARLAEALAASGRYVLLDTAPVAAKARLRESLALCGGCDAPLAAELGAALSITAVVQKTSNLILSMTVVVRDAATGAVVGGGSADMRGNTDESWRRAVDYIVERRLLVP